MPSGFIDVSKFSYQEFQDLANMSEDERTKALERLTKHVFTPEEVTRVEPMTFFEELIAVLIFLFGVPGSVISIPVVFGLLGFITGKHALVWTIAAVISVTLAVIPAPFVERSLTSWPAIQVLRYFSFKGIFEEHLKNHKPYILVAPPHGVFPFGNIITMIAFPSLTGFSFRGLAASAAILTPFFRQFLCTIGVVDASRSTATKVC
jgi:hypothetical protein